MHALFASVHYLREYTQWLREAIYEAEESRAVRSGLSKTHVALKASTKRHQEVSLERDQLQSQLQQEKQKTVCSVFRDRSGPV